MSKLKLRISIIIALAIACVATLGAFFTLKFAKADRPVYITGSSIFTTVSDAAVWAHESVNGEGDSEYKEYFTMFAFKDEDDVVNYRRNLAYKWFANTALTEEKDVNGNVVNGADRLPNLIEDIKNPASASADYFNMEIGFEAVNFKKFMVVFESQQYAQTKGDKTVNYVIFTPAENGVYVTVTDDDKDTDHNETVLSSGHITISFSESVRAGEYTVTVADADGHSVEGAFTNILGTYAQSTSTSSVTVTPLSFKAEFEEAKEPAEGETTNEEDAYVRMVMYKLNGQSFRIGTFASATLSDTDKQNVSKFYVKNQTGKYVKVADGAAYNENATYYTYNSGVTTDKNHFTGGSINDDTAPVLCLDNTLAFVQSGAELSFDYTVIDVLSQSSTKSVAYFMLTDKQLDGEFNANDCSVDGPYKEVTDDDNQWMIPHTEHYMPVANYDDPAQSEYNTSVFDNESNSTVTAAVKVYLKLTDTSSSGVTTYVLLDWYVDEDYLVTVNGQKYIAVASDEIGATYAYTKVAEKKSNPDDEHWTAMLAAYQQKVNAAAKGLKAGSKNYFYLPSLDDIEYEVGGLKYRGSLVGDNVDKYSDLKYSIYYNNGSQQSNTGRASSALSINLTKSGDYLFTVYATDSASNKMYYFDESGNKKEFETSDIWTMYNDTDKEGLRALLPWFTFTVASSEISIEDPKEQSIAYVGTTYSSISFEINGISSEYTTSYKLYRFENEEYYKAEGTTLNYYDFLNKKAELFEDPVKRNLYFTHIYATNEMKEEDEEYEVYSKYEWNSSSPSFIPQDDNTFYLVVCEVVSTSNSQQGDTAYMGISASPRAATLKGDDTWLQDNLTSIILLCVAGVSLIGVILLLVIKPKDKGDIDESFAAEAKKKEKKSKKSE